MYRSKALLSSCLIPILLILSSGSAMGAEPEADEQAVNEETEAEDESAELTTTIGGDASEAVSEPLTLLAPSFPSPPPRAGSRAGDGPGDAASDGDAADEPVIQREVQAESAELEQVREAEEKAHLSVSEERHPPDRAASAAAMLGLESPLRMRLRDAYGRGSGPRFSESERIPGLPEIDHDLRRLQAEYDIPIEVNDKVLAYVRFFQAPGVRPHFAKWIARSHKYIPKFREILREFELPEDTVYLAMIESGFANHATSRAKAVGPWQFIGATGKRMGLRQDFWVDERRDPEKSARAAAKYLKELYGQTGDWRLAWAGYNAGVGRIYKARRKGHDDFWSMARARRVLKKETAGYVPKLMAAAIVTKHAESFGFTRDLVQPEYWQEVEQVTVPQATPFSVLSEAAEISEKEIMDLNPELRRTCTPPREYSLKVPKGKAEVFARNWPRFSESVGMLAFANHRVNRGESLSSIANKYRVDRSTVARLNGLRPGRRVRPGTELVIPMNALARTQSATFASADASAEQKRSRRGGGQRAIVRASTPPRDIADRSRETVKVQAGDSLWGIARKFGVAVEELCRWNGISNPRRIKLQIGRSLVVYPKRVTTASG